MADTWPSSGEQRWYALSGEEVMVRLDTAPAGLPAEEVIRRQARYGRNELQEAARRSRLSILVSQFRDLMIIILFLAAVVSFALGEYTDAAVIVAIILANAWMGYSQESRAEDSIRLLQKMVPRFAMVRRNGIPVRTESAGLVPGDIMLLEPGDIVPADGRLLTVSSLKAEEAALTGESQPAEKKTGVLTGSDLNPGDQSNMVFKGTMISNGTAVAVATATGMQTEIGRIAGMMASSSPVQTPLQKRLTVFTKQLAVFVLFVGLLVFGLGIWRGAAPFLMFLTALSLAVAALPEALPAVITIALSRGARRMADLNALVRNLPAVETLGSVTYICSDKTGTLTRNVMEVEKVRAAAGHEELLKYAMLLNNDVRFGDDGALMGDSTETALVRYALDGGYPRDLALRRYPLRAALPFDSDRMRMSTLHQDNDRWILLVKGAPVRICEALRDTGQAEALLIENRQWAGEGLRVLFFAFRFFEERPDAVSEDLEKDLDFLGMAGIMDPPREEVVESLRECRTAGIRTVMITGDQPVTAAAIAQRLGMAGDQAPETRTGVQLNGLTEEDLAATVKRVFVYARVSPVQKLQIVRALQRNGEFVAMTGDGVNDAPSLKHADIGVAMGITGTGVSRESADMVLLDDNFATIVAAVREGRRIYDNIRKFILYILSCNLAEILTILVAPFLGFAMPLLPTQILWINLVTDGLPGLALVNEPAQKDLMKRPPRSPAQSLFAGGLLARILLNGVLMALTAMCVQGWAVGSGYDERSQQTMVFTALCFIQLGNALSVRSASSSFFSPGIFHNRGLWASILVTIGCQLAIIYVPFFQPVFKTVPPDWPGMLAIISFSAGSLVALELIKYVFQGIDPLSRTIRKQFPRDPL